MGLFNAEEFKTGTEPKRRELIGNIIYDHIERIVGMEKAPKLCGMVIDLPQAELYESLHSLETLTAKVKVGADLLKEAQEKEKEKK